MRPIITEVTRSVNDSHFSMDELFYRYFGEMPLLFCQAGSTDLYDHPRLADESEDLDNKPQKGPSELNDCINKLFLFLNEKGLSIDINNPTQVQIAKYCDFSDNTFISYIVFIEHETIVRLRVAPNNRETLTSVSILGRNEKTPVWANLIVFCRGFIALPRVQKDEINIITLSDGEFYLKSIPLSTTNRQKFSYDFYNEEFKGISERVLTALQSANESGLVLLHGNPGTGKTSYLKYLLHAITKKKLIYLPPDLIESLSAPNFISFLMSKASNSILLIEDAENVLRHREAGGNQAVSNILNISDGILGDVLRLQIVCTFNSKLTDIDSALRRPGRLIAEYRFEKLTANRTSTLMHRLYGEQVEYKKPEMTLAEIFNFKKMPDKSKEIKRGVGFIDTDAED